MAGKSKSETEAPITQSELQKAVSDAASSAAKAAVDALMPAVAAAVKGSNGQTVVQAAQTRERPPMQRCGVCKQNVKACNNEHVKVVVYPKKFPQFAKWFQGARINGVTYLSDGPQVSIDVPKEAVGSILSMVQNWEDNEAEIRVGRKHTHNSGGLGEGAKGAKSATVGWR